MDTNSTIVTPLEAISTDTPAIGSQGKIAETGDPVTQIEPTLGLSKLDHVNGPKVGLNGGHCEDVASVGSCVAMVTNKSTCLEKDNVNNSCSTGEEAMSSVDVTNQNSGCDISITSVISLAETYNLEENVAKDSVKIARGNEETHEGKKEMASLKDDVKRSVESNETEKSIETEKYNVTEKSNQNEKSNENNIQISDRKGLVISHIKELEPVENVAVQRGSDIHDTENSDLEEIEFAITDIRSLEADQDHEMMIETDNISEKTTKLHKQPELDNLTPKINTNTENVLGKVAYTDNTEKGQCETESSADGQSQAKSTIIEDTAKDRVSAAENATDQCAETNEETDIIVEETFKIMDVRSLSEEKNESAEQENVPEKDPRELSDFALDNMVLNDETGELQLPPIESVKESNLDLNKITQDLSNHQKNLQDINNSLLVNANISKSIENSSSIFPSASQCISAIAATVSKVGLENISPHAPFSTAGPATSEMPVIVPASIGSVGNFMTGVSHKKSDSVSSLGVKWSMGQVPVSTKLSMATVTPAIVTTASSSSILGKDFNTENQANGVSTAAEIATDSGTGEFGFPVISNVFSVKPEPADDSSYGSVSPSMTTTGSQTNGNRGTISSIVSKLHGRKVDPPSVGLSSSKTLVMTKVSGKNVGTSQVPETVQYLQPSVSNRQKGISFQNQFVPHPLTSGQTVQPGIRTVQPSNKQNIVQVTTLDGRQRLVQTGVGQANYLSPHARSKQVIQTSPGNPQLLPGGPVPHPVKVTYTVNSAQKGPLEPCVIISSVKKGQKLILPRGAQFTTISPAVTPLNQPKSVQPMSSTQLTVSSAATAENENGFSGGINIQTVGVARITELIARKNPIAMYKPPPIPDNLKNTASKKTYPCYECGDSFYREKSLNIHITRCSMHLQYKCVKCNAQLNFTNKCQLLSHLRSHLNIDKTQAVPIHIKSDSIQIKTVYDEIGSSAAGDKFEWFNEKMNKFNAINMNSCAVCHVEFNTQNCKRIDHFSPVNSHSKFGCDQCSMVMPTKCGLELHKELHILKDNTNASDKLVCPECGVFFGKHEISDFCAHVALQCFHLSRVWNMKCSKCNQYLATDQDIKKHLIHKLDHYYKCEECPMALKSLKSFRVHFRQHHGILASGKCQVKMIYRCHCCDTLIDDREFLMSHIEKHVSTYTKCAGFVFSCRLCEDILPIKRQLKSHYGTRHRGFVYNPNLCGYCKIIFSDEIQLLVHNLEKHQQKFHVPEAFFCECGLVCTNHKMLKEHDCLFDREVSLDVEISSDENDSQPGGVVGKKKQKPGKTFQKSQPIERGFKCPLCNIVFASNSGRINHIRSHRNKNEYICVSCDRTNFTSYPDLKNHEIVCLAVKKQNVNKSKSDISQKDKLNSEGSNKGRGKDFGKVSLDLKGVNQANMFVDKGETFKCDKCNMVFTRKSKQEEHVKAEHGLHPCHLCGIMYESQSTLKCHLLLKHEGKKLVYYCWVCRCRKVEKYYSEKSALEKHLGQKHRMKTWDESKLVPELPGLDMKGVSPEPQKRRSESSSPADEPAIKKLRVEGESLFKCAKCVFTCESKEEFREHIVEHGTDNTVQCLECGLCFTVLPSLRRHLFMVHKVRDFDTYIKENSIQEPKDLEDDDFIERESIHSEIEESEEEEEEVGNALECKVCYKEFDTEHGLKRHMRTHGMAFIKKSRRRATASKAAASSDASLASSNDEATEDLAKPRKKARTMSTGSSNRDKEGDIVDEEKVDNVTTADGLESESTKNTDETMGKLDGLKVKISVSQLNDKGDAPVKWVLKEIK